MKAAQSKKKPGANVKQEGGKDKDSKGNAPASSGSQDAAQMTAAQLSILKVAAGNHEKSDMVNVTPLYVCMQRI